MTKYPQIQKSLNRLNKLFTLIKIKEKQIPTAIEFNQGNLIYELYVAVPKLRKELKALKKEYRDLTRKIKIK